MLKNLLIQVAQKGPDTRRPKSQGVRRIQKYAAISLPRRKAGRDEGNPAIGGIDGPFSGTC